MKHLITLLSFVLFAIITNAQNLVPNYSFEQDDSCPTSLNGRMTYGYTLGCVGWGQATAGTPDYFNACDTGTPMLGPWAGVPNNNYGFQYAYEGVAYTGIYTYGEGDYKEYLITNIPELEIDTAYEVTIHVCLASLCEYATDGMGVLFTTYGSPNPYTHVTLTKTPQVDYTSYGVIKEINQWTTLSGIFIADSAYTSLIIGGFKSSTMNIITVNDSPTYSNNISYYYIDNVVVERLSSTGISSVNNNNETHVYPNPFSDHATLLFSNAYNQSFMLSIFNVQGQLVQKTEGITSDRIRIERNGLPSGFYYYHLSNETNITASGKLIIK